MKRLFSLLAILAIIFVSNCSRIPENNDPVIGIWYKTELFNNGLTTKQSLRKEWIFNDAYLGRYEEYAGSNLQMKTDFKWEEADEVYTISYPGTDKLPVRVQMKEGPDGISLEDDNGNILAIRE
jgi:hypothetical protein